MADYKKVLAECQTRMKVYRHQDAVWNATHEKECIEVISDLLDKVGKAEKERDEIKSRYCSKEPCTTCIHYRKKNCDENCLACTSDCPCNKCEEYSRWEWNGQKEE